MFKCPCSKGVRQGSRLGLVIRIYYMDSWIDFFPHWIGNVILMRFSALVALEVAILTVSGAANGDNFVKMTFPIQCCRIFTFWVKSTEERVFRMGSIIELSIKIVSRCCNHTLTRKGRQSDCPDHRCRRFCSFNVSSDNQGSHPDDLSVSLCSNRLPKSFQPVRGLYAF